MKVMGMCDKSSRQPSAVSCQQKRGDIFLIAAMEIEVKPLLAHFWRISPKNPLLYELRSDHADVQLVISGVGSKRAAEAARWVSERKPELVIGLGYAGGLSPALALGELFLPREICDIQGKRLSCRGPWPVSGTLLSMDRVVQSREDKEKLRPMADAVDMESFPIAEVMSQNGIPFTVIRAISDTANDTLPLDFTGLLEGQQAVIWGAINLLLRNPLRIPSVLKLAFQSKAISRRLSRFSLSAISGLSRGH